MRPDTRPVNRVEKNMNTSRHILLAQRNKETGGEETYPLLK